MSPRWHSTAAPPRGRDTQALRDIVAWSGSVERSPARFRRSSKSRERVHIPQAPSKTETPDVCSLSICPVRSSAWRQLGGRLVEGKGRGHRGISLA